MKEPGSDRAPGDAFPLSAALLCGAAMGAADAVPGVSGGTIALILGIYDRFLGSIHAVIRAASRPTDREARRQLVAALRFLFPLLLGLAVAYILASKLLVGPKDRPGWLLRPDTAPRCYAFFLGLVLFSLKDPWRRIQMVTWRSWVLALTGALVAFLVAGLPQVQARPEVWMLFFGGAFAICAMLLPGVSGSLLLLTLGQYQEVHGAAQDVVHGQFGALPRLLVFLAGLILGVAGFVPFLRRLLRTAPDPTMALLTGLMAGSMRSLWPYKESYDYRTGLLRNAALGANAGWLAALVLAGGAAILLLTWAERRLVARTAPEAA